MNQGDIKSIFNQGLKLGPNVNKDRYICPITGAHFEWRDMCKRLEPIAQQRGPRDIK
jgi:hypothetical protein